ncbi:MAG: hypothetical protein JSW07_07140 [bacterium]|nr:MAG: hypothetical protein JSW07_07140 [bacterium]
MYKQQLLFEKSEKFSDGLVLKLPVITTDSDSVIAVTVEVKSMNGQYSSDQKILSAFLRDCCRKEDSGWTWARDLYLAFSRWSGDQFRWSQKRFGHVLGKRYSRRKYGCYQYFGIALNEKITGSAKER